MSDALSWTWSISSNLLDGQAIGENMFSYMDDVRRGLLVSIPKNQVIDSCEKTLEAIKKYRSDLRRIYVQTWMEDKTYWWKLIWRWLGFRKPTRRQALYTYYHEGQYPMSCTASFASGRQEEECRLILNAARLTDKESIWLTPESVSDCGLKHSIKGCKI